MGIKSKFYKYIKEELEFVLYKRKFLKEAEEDTDDEDEDKKPELPKKLAAKPAAVVPPTPPTPPEPTPEPAKVIQPIQGPPIEPEEPNEPVAEPEPITINTSQAKQMIKDTKGRFFTVTFTKKSDGSIRVMNCRLGVRAYLHGGALRYNPEAKGMIPVYDVQKRGYRIVTIDNIISLKIGNQTYKVL